MRASSVHAFPPIHVPARGELGTSSLDSTCLVWRVGNAEPLWVNSVVSKNDGGFHHSNWFVYGEAFTEADGIWNGCPLTTGVGVGKGHEPCGNRGGGTARRSVRGVLERPGVVGRTEGQGLGGRLHPELRQVGLAERHESGLAEPRTEIRVGGGAVVGANR